MKKCFFLFVFVCAWSFLNAENQGNSNGSFDVDSDESYIEGDVEMDAQVAPGVFEQLDRQITMLYLNEIAQAILAGENGWWTPNEGAGDHEAAIMVNSAGSIF